MTGAARRSRQLYLRDLEASRLNGALNPGSIAKPSLQELRTRLATPEHLRGLGENFKCVFLLPPKLGLLTEWNELATRSGTGTYSTGTSSTFPQNWTPERRADGLTHS